MSNDRNLNQAVADILGKLLDDGRRTDSSVPRQEFSHEASANDFNNRLFDKLVADCADLFLLFVEVRAARDGDFNDLAQVCSQVLEATIGTWALQERIRMDRRDEDACYGMQDTYDNFMEDLKEWRNGRLPRRFERGGRDTRDYRDNRGGYDDRRGYGGGRDFRSNPRSDNRNGTSNAFTSARGVQQFGSEGTDTRRERYDRQERVTTSRPSSRFDKIDVREDPKPVDSLSQLNVVSPSAASSVEAESGSVEIAREVSVKEALKHRPLDAAIPFMTAYDPFVETVVAYLTTEEHRKNLSYFSIKKIEGENIMDQARHSLASTFGSGSFSLALPGEDIQAIRNTILENNNRIVDAAEEAFGGVPRNPETPRYLEVNAESTPSLEFGMDAAWVYRRAEFDQHKKTTPSLDVYVRSNYLLEPIKVTTPEQLQMLAEISQVVTINRFMEIYRDLMKPSTGLPQVTANILDRRMTNVVNAALRVNLGMPKLRIQSFAEDFEMLPGYLYSSSGSTLGNALNKHIPMKLPYGCTLFGNENRQTLLEALNYESDIVPETQALVTEVKTAVVGLNVAEMGFAYDSGIPALITREHTPLLFNLSTILMKNYRPHNRYLVETADGYRFEVSKSWVSDNEMLIAAL